MRAIIPQNFINLASVCQFSLYIVGGSVRDFLCGFPVSAQTDWDICASATEDELFSAAKEAGFTVTATYRNTGTVKLRDNAGVEYEFTRFRSDKYVRGLHAPSEITFTDDIKIDAMRRDFTCNAVYYDVKEDKFVDPLGGMEDIRRKILRTVAPAKKVFGEDGLRLMRLCRQAAQLGFAPDEDCLAGAKAHCALIEDIAPERVFSELTLLLHADEKHGVTDGAYTGLRLMREVGVLAHVLPELALGDGLVQRADFHDHDVLEHSLRCVRYAPPSIRLAALLHDVGKPFCYLRDGNVYEHAKEGARLAREILTRLKAPKKLTEEVALLVGAHMKDGACNMREIKVRREIVRCYPLLDELLALKQADCTACKDDFTPAPNVVRWREILAKMRREGVPFNLSQLKINGNDLLALGAPPKRVGELLSTLLDYAVEDGARNTRARLLRRAKRLLEDL